MRTIIAGSRGLKRLLTVFEAIDACGWIPTVVLSGACMSSVDRLGEEWANSQKICPHHHSLDETVSYSLSSPAKALPKNSEDLPSSSSP